MAESSLSITVNVGVLSNARAAAIQQAASSEQSQSPQVPISGGLSANQSQQTSSQTYNLVWPYFPAVTIITASI